ncbi:MAG: hypothetical protein ABEJ31_08135 [Haloarculaceae archaeon]
MFETDSPEAARRVANRRFRIGKHLLLVGLALFGAGVGYWLTAVPQPVRLEVTRMANPLAAMLTAPSLGVGILGLSVTMVGWFLFATAPRLHAVERSLLEDREKFS